VLCDPRGDAEDPLFEGELEEVADNITKTNTLMSQTKGGRGGAKNCDPNWTKVGRFFLPKDLGAPKDWIEFSSLVLTAIEALEQGGGGFSNAGKKAGEYSESQIKKRNPWRFKMHSASSKGTNSNAGGCAMCVRCKGASCRAPPSVATR